MKYGRAIRLVRTSRGLSQKELARNADLDPSYISLLESNSRIPSSETVELLSQRLDVPMYLLTFLASEKNDLRGVDEKQSQEIGEHLLKILLHFNLKGR